jgi:beta-lactamase class D
MHLKPDRKKNSPTQSQLSLNYNDKNWFNLILLTILLTAFPSVVIANNDHSICSTSNKVRHEPCTFVLLNGDTNKLTIINKERAVRRISPFSTFKIPNSLIAFETDVVPTIDAAIDYNPNIYPAETWWPKIWLQQQHTIESAFKYSVVPIYRTIANSIGEKTMQTMLNKFDYGNKDISSGLDNFWLDKSLQISAVEQIEFLRKVHEKSLNLKTSSYEKLNKIMLVEQKKEYQLYAKTGGGQVSKSLAQGWYVGYVITNNTPFYFAFNMDANNFSDIQHMRTTIAMAELIRLGVLTK